MADIPKMFYRFLNNNFKSNQMTNLNAVSLKTQTEVAKFHEWLHRTGNIYLADIDRMDRAFNIVKDNIESLSNAKKPVKKGLSKV